MSRAAKILIFGMFLVIVVYSILDLYQTIYMIKYGNEELNIFVRFFVDRFGIFNGILIIKSIMCTLLLGVTIITIKSEGG